MSRASHIGALALALLGPSLASAAPAVKPVPATAPAPAKTVAPVAEEPALPVEKQLDVALSRYYGHAWDDAAARFHRALAALPETDIRRDTVTFYLASSLASLGLGQAAIEEYLDVVGARRSPELIGRAMGILDALVRQRELDEGRVIDEVVFGLPSGDLPTETGEFVEYYQALGELRRGFADLGTRRLESLAQSPRYYGWRARHALAVARLAQGADEGAEKLLRTIVDDNAAPDEVRNDARLAVARLLYEHKRFTDAFALYQTIDAPLPQQDVVLLEKAWTQVAGGDERRALGEVVGLGAPVYRRLFAPERALIQAVALRRLCQFRAAHLGVLEFRRRYRDTLHRIKDRMPLAQDPVLVDAVRDRPDLLPAARRLERLEAERARAAKLRDEALRTDVVGVYDARIGRVRAEVDRGLERALEQIADQLLSVDEQMSIIDYEISVGLFQAPEGGAAVASHIEPIPASGQRVFYKFDGEYWSDEIQDLSVYADDRCPR